MRKKYTLSLFIIIGLSFSGMMISVLGQPTYTCRVKVGDQNIMELLEIDEYRSIMTGYELGATSKMQVSNVTEHLLFFVEGIIGYSIQVNIWDPIAADETFNTNPDSIVIFYVPTDPTTLSVATPVVLGPVNSYLSEYVSVVPPGNLTSNGNTLTSVDWPFSSSFTYGSNGLLSGMEHSNNTAMLERWGIKGQSSGIPGYDLSIVIGLTTIAVLSLVYIWKKKRLK